MQAARVSPSRYHDQVIESVLTPDIVKCANVRVVELRDRFRLALETDLEVGVLRQLRGKHLYRHGAAEAGVTRFPHLAHPARADRRDDFVRPEARTRVPRPVVGRRGVDRDRAVSVENLNVDLQSV